MPDANVTYDNLAATLLFKNDGNLAPEATARGPRIFVIGTAGKGRGSIGYLVPSTTDAKSEFGTDGNLLRGMWEAKAMGATEIALYRIGATPAILDGVGDSVGTAGGYKIETVSQDADAGGDYAIWYDDTTDRLVVIRTSDSLVVYDNNEDLPIERYEVTVSGYRATAGGPDIGSASSFVNLEDVDPSTYAGTSFVAGDDGLGLSRMEMYEKLYVAYEHIKEYDWDVVVPMDIYLDDYNVAPQGHYLGAITPVVPGGSTYPTAGRYRPGTDVDALGYVFTEEYEGTSYFWWWFSDGGAFTAADIYPVDAPGSASTTLKIDGTALAAADFHEVNFAYQLGRFLYEYGTNVVDATGTIGVLPPASQSLTDRSRWAGIAPTLTLNTSTGLYTVASASDNGTGLLGNQFMAGKNDWRSGFNGGGFIATETKFMDDTEILGDNEIPVDLGKYFCVVPDWVLLSNNFSSTAYLTSFAASYGGFYLTRSPASAPTNKPVSRTSLVYRFGLQTLDALAGAGYTVLRAKSTPGLVIADAPTAALASSDWTRLSTVRIVKAVVDGVRAAIEPYLGEGMSDSTRAAMTNDIEKVLLEAKKGKFLQDYRPFEVIQTPQMKVEGKADVALTLIPAFELRQVTLTVSVSK